jgi:hypothetical protein
MFYYYREGLVPVEFAKLVPPEVAAPESADNQPDHQRRGPNPEDGDRPHPLAANFVSLRH